MSFIKYTYRILIRLFSSANFVCNSIRYKCISSRDKYIVVTLDSISFWVEDKNFRKFSFPGLVFSGRFWDKKKEKHEVLRNSLKFKGIEEHFKYDVDWIDTSLFQLRYKPIIESGKEVKGCTDLVSLAKKYYFYDELYEDIKINGISTDLVDRSIDPIYVYIDGDGSIVYTSNGNHRIYISMILGVKEIPVKVWGRHTHWQEIRDELKLTGEELFYSKYPHLLGHPDLDDVL